MDGKYKNLPWALAKEMSKAESHASWESKNEGIHERISFNDTIWGFNLAGGAYYDTPLRVTQVDENSRADKAGIKVGDVLRFINDVDTSLLTLQEAHDIILQSGIEIKLQLSAPDVEEPYHYTYEDEILEELREMKRKRDEKSKKKRKPFTGARTNADWSCAWPCNKKRDVMYRESNCFLIPSKYEEKMRLIKEKKKLEEERLAAQINKEKILSLMKTQNAYHMMEPDEEIEPQYLEILSKNTKEMNEIINYNNIGRELICKNNAELSEKQCTSNENIEHNGDENSDSCYQNTAEVFENHIYETKLYDEVDNDKLRENYTEFQANDFAETDGDIKISNENETIILEATLNGLTFTDVDFSEEELKNKVSESENKNHDDYEDINFQNDTVLNVKDETRISVTESSIPSDDDEMFHEELVIFDKNENDSDRLSNENNLDNKELFPYDANKRNGYKKNDETTVTN